MIRDLNFDLFDVLNKVNVDKFRRVSAFFAINKPIGITSHDLVDQVRKKLGTRQVGHVGALDPSASGVMLILVGKRFTRLSDTLMKLDKRYRVEILIGVATDTQDLEGKITETKEVVDLSEDKIKEVLKTFEGVSKQYVPVFSSVKIDGKKLRVLARQADNFEIFDKDEVKFVRFDKVDSGKDLEIELPFRDVRIENIEYLQEIPPITLPLEWGEKVSSGRKIFEVEFDCSKGTYVRQFAYDVASKLGYPGMVVKLIRTRLGPVKLENCIGIEDVREIH